MDDNYLQITIVGKGGIKNGTVCTDKIAIDGLTSEKVLEFALKVLTEFNSFDKYLGFVHPRLIKATETGWVRENKDGTVKYQIQLIVKGNPGFPDVEARFENDDPRETRKAAQQYLDTLPK